MFAVIVWSVARFRDNDPGIRVGTGLKAQIMASKAYGYRTHALLETEYKV